MKKLKELKPGETFKYGEIDWIALEHKGDTTFCLAKDIVCERIFDNRDSNNWKISELREYLHKKFLKQLVKNGADENSFIEFEQDLTADDGLKDYGTCVDKISLLTCEQYRKYRYLVPQIDKSWWTATAYSSSASYYTNARYVTYGGNVYYYSVTNSLGVRPALLLKSDISIGDKPSLSEVERILLKNLPEGYEWIIRDRDGDLVLFSEKPTKDKYYWKVYNGSVDILDTFSHLFQFIKWEDDEPYSIEEILKGAEE